MYKLIHYFGDSHRRNYSYIDRMDRHGEDSMSMYRMTTEDGDRFLSANKEGLWMFGFGEIDCRTLIYNQITEKNREEDEIIITLFNNFYNKVSALYNELAFVSVMPPAAVFTDNPKIDITDSFKGSDEDRLRYTLKLNILMRNKCIEKNHIYVDLYSVIKNEKGFLRKDLSEDGLHLSDFTMIPDLLLKYNI